MEYIENKTEEYFKQLDALDEQENKSDDLPAKMEKLQSKISKLKDRKQFYDSIAERPFKCSDGQVSNCSLTHDLSRLSGKLSYEAIKPPNKKFAFFLLSEYSTLATKMSLLN